MSDSTIATLTAQGAGTYTTPDMPCAGSLKLGIYISAISGTTPTLTVTIQGKDTASGQYYTILASVALNATGFTLLQVAPLLAAAANSVANAAMPTTWRVQYVVAGTGPSVTATIGASIKPS
jgi:hypothetical protein